MGVMLDLDVTTPKQALESMAMRMTTMHGLNSELVFRAVWRREQAASTAIGHGIALPHARVGGTHQLILLLARTRHPIVFGAPNGQPVSILLTIVVPEHASDDHPQILALAAERLANYCAESAHGVEMRYLSNLTWRPMKLETWHTAQFKRFVIMDNAQDKQSNWNWWYLLFAIQFVIVLWPPFYNTVEPSWMGVPFFYWYQLLCVLIGAVLTAIVYFATERSATRN